MVNRLVSVEDTLSIPPFVRMVHTPGDTSLALPVAVKILSG